MNINEVLRSLGNSSGATSRPIRPSKLPFFGRRSVYDVRNNVQPVYVGKVELTSNGFDAGGYFWGKEDVMYGLRLYGAFNEVQTALLFTWALDLQEARAFFQDTYPELEFM